MPQFRIHGIEPEKIVQISKEMTDTLTEIIGCPREYFVFECIQSTAIKDGEIIPVPPFIEVYWFDRGLDVQDMVAKEVTTRVRSLGIPSIDIAFLKFERRNYYENAEHF